MTTPSEAQIKWDLMHTFSYAYICQPPKEYWEDEEFMMQRDILFNQVHHDVHRTEWKTIYSRYNEFLPIRLAFKDAKEYYEAQLIGSTTTAYQEIRGYAERMDKQRAEMRRPKVIVPEKPKKKK
jgi:hypothetical protein